jgi:hypothetical protein
MNAHALCTDATGSVGGVKMKRGPVTEYGTSRKKKKGKGYLTAAATAPPAEKRDTAPDICPSILNPKSRRINWALGEALDKLTKAVRDWNATTGSSLDNKKVKVSLRTYDVAVKIPYSTLQYYACDDNTKRKQLFLLMGRHPLLKHRSQDFVRNVLT